MRETYIIFLVAFATCLRGGLSNEDIPTPEKRLISTFQIVRFPNDVCIGSSSRNGTCYTSAECSDKGGASSGSCADGFGVCCTFVITTCAQSSSENITYWDMTPTDITTRSTTCDLQIFPMNDNICQLRIDFDAFVITGPSTTSVIEGHHQLGGLMLIGITAETDMNWRSNCLIDRFSVNGVSTSNQPPSICGTNTGYHMYVDANPQSNTMSIKLGAMAGPAPAKTAIDTRGLGSTATRNWDIKVLQYECGHINAAPPGCTQYYWGVTSGKIRSYNFAGAVALANQDQRVCMRRERGYCYICFAAATELKIGGGENALNAFTFPTQPCGYASETANDATAKAGFGAAEKQAGAYDCAIIPGAFVIAKQSDGTYAAIATEANIKSLVDATYQTPASPQIGSNGPIGPGAATLLTTPIVIGHANAATTCSKHVPFMFIFKSDDHEGLGAGGEYGDESTAKANLNPGMDVNWFSYVC